MTPYDKTMGHFLIWCIKIASKANKARFKKWGPLKELAIFVTTYDKMMGHFSIWFIKITSNQSFTLCIFKLAFVPGIIMVFSKEHFKVSQWKSKSDNQKMSTTEKSQIFKYVLSRERVGLNNSFVTRTFFHTWPYVWHLSLTYQ